MALLKRYNTTPGDEDPRSVSRKRIQVLKRGQSNSSPEVRTKRLKSQSADKTILTTFDHMAVSLPTFPPFQVHLDGNVGPRWKKWLARFENLIVGMGNEDAKQKRALLLHYSGPEVDEIFDTLEDTGEDKDYTKAVEKLTAHFNPQVNTTYEVYNFRKAQQNEGESFDNFHTRLRTLAKTCEFADADKEIKEQIILLKLQVKRTEAESTA